jgi:hypothetical protein
MAEIVNLHRVKKARARAEVAARAAENRTRHGRTAAQKVAETQEEARRRALLDGARREDADQ